MWCSSVHTRAQLNAGGGAVGIFVAPLLIPVAGGGAVGIFVAPLRDSAYEIAKLVAIVIARATAIALARFEFLELNIGASFWNNDSDIDHWK
ncbi:MAG: hypothetical protein NTZ35_02180 [Ignavibacteriales bacterium]|nr:hypothetical protein [Ignavibacteriales bacterium]